MDGTGPPAPRRPARPGLPSRAGTIRNSPPSTVLQPPCSIFFFSSRRRHTRLQGDWSSDVCSSDLCAIDTRKEISSFQRSNQYGKRRIRETYRWCFYCTSTLHRYVFWPENSLLFNSKIGRASCRERV